MPDIDQLFKNNQQWAEAIKREEPDFFEQLSKQQTPKYLWIGCSDSRVPANEIVGMQPGELFVHRNVANVVAHTDLNCLSVLQYAVEYLKVEHIAVVGHYGCGGVAAAMEDNELGLIDNWLRNIKDVYHWNRKDIENAGDHKQQVNRLCELNVKQQVSHVCHTTIVQNAWKRGQKLAVHGWIYGIEDGMLKSLERGISSAEQIPAAYRMS
ncbi:Carbonic anhydrase 2 [Sinobacterium norvegicum]|uniref:carbonic anhydrase n=1 Tax=Sinobacterium norvegicum TaxID=1641715 RepID=A0ABM9A9T9_9GAMM|nr:carbonate dehydratase [Sinobacterium norvegicum]CAH0989967.1 Carbonic anhydrase 2 [Sinobacterium norvegicum]